MIFLSQSGLTDPSREKAWAAWYADHLRVMVTVPGITSAQRFTTATPGHPPLSNPGEGERDPGGRGTSKSSPRNHGRRGVRGRRSR